MRQFGSRPHRNRKRTLWARGMALLLVLFTLALALDHQVRPVIKTMSAYRARLFAVRSINSAIGNELAGDTVPYDSLVSLATDHEGRITAIQTDMVALNRLRSRITDAVLEELSSMEHQQLRIPAGTLSGIQMLSGRGPRIEFRVVPAGFLQTDLENKFESAGINQTRHQILLNLQLTVTAIVPGYSSSAEVSTSCCLAETVIVGTVPEAFTQVADSQSEIAGIISDYGPDETRPLQ